MVRKYLLPLIGIFIFIIILSLLSSKKVFYEGLEGKTNDSSTSTNNSSTSTSDSSTSTSSSTNKESKHSFYNKNGDLLTIDNKNGILNIQQKSGPISTYSVNIGNPSDRESSIKTADYDNSSIYTNNLGDTMEITTMLKNINVLILTYTSYTTGIKVYYKISLTSSAASPPTPSPATPALPDTSTPSSYNPPQNNNYDPSRSNNYSYDSWNKNNYPPHHHRNYPEYDNNNGKGISRDMIPKGDENLYILKSQIVPPVCPVCPNLVSKCEKVDGKDIPPCPPCARCPEPSFNCAKVPNYSAGRENRYLPVPVLNDFTSFGM